MFGRPADSGALHRKVHCTASMYATRYNIALCSGCSISGATGGVIIGLVYNPGIWHKQCSLPRQPAKPPQDGSCDSLYGSYNRFRRPSTAENGLAGESCSHEVVLS